MRARVAQLAAFIVCASSLLVEPHARAESVVAQLEPVYFARGAAELSAEQRGGLRLSLAFLLRRRQPFVIECHTRGEGGVATELFLARQRADAVFDALVEMGVPARLLAREVYAGSRPVEIDGRVDDARSRRCEFVIAPER